MQWLPKHPRRSWAVSRADVEMIAYVVAGVSVGQAIAWAVWVWL